MEPGNQQATQLLEIIRKKRKKDAMIGAAVLGMQFYLIICALITSITKLISCTQAKLPVA